MTKADMDTLLAFLFDGKGIGATVDFVLELNGETVVKRADVEVKTQMIIREQFIAALKKEIIDNSELRVLSLKRSQDRKGAVYEYDFKERPEGVEVIDQALRTQDPEMFSFSKDKLEHLRALIIILGNDKSQLAIFKRMYPINVLKRDSMLKIIHQQKHFVALKSDVVTINDSFDFVQIRGHLFIFNTGTLEQMYGFHKLIKKRALKGIGAIAKAGIIENPNVFKPMLEDVSFARKMAKVTLMSPVLDAKIPVEEIIAFTQTHPALKGKFKYNEDNTRIVLHTKQAKKLFLKLLNDDYLISELTSQQYESLVKDPVPTSGARVLPKAAGIARALGQVHP